MDRWKQYGILLSFLTVCTTIGIWGFTATGGALPYGSRFATTLKRGTHEGGGPLIELGRGILLAGPIREGGMVVEFLVLLGLFILVGIVSFVYFTRNNSSGRFDTSP